MKATNWNGSNSAKRVLQNRPITGGRKPPKGVNIMSVLAYRDPVRMALRLEIKALQKQVRQLKDLLDEANTYIPADRYILTRDKLGSWFYKQVTSKEKTS